jgi:hypothetical protein
MLSTVRATELEVGHDSLLFANAELSGERLNHSTLAFGGSGVFQLPRWGCTVSGNDSDLLLKGCHQA